MSKSVSSPLGTVLVLDPPEEIDRKVRKAVTDTETEVRYDPAHKPGVSNLLELLAAATGGDPAELAGRYASYGQLKADVAEALVELLRPVRERYAELHGRPRLRGVGAGRRARPRPGPWPGPPSTGPCGPPGCSLPRAASVLSARLRGQAPASQARRRRPVVAAPG